MKNISLAITLLFALTSTRAQIVVAPAFNQRAPQGNPLPKVIESVRYVDPSNSSGWAGSDVGAWINSAIAGQPSTGGQIYIEAGAYTQSTTVTINRPGISIVGAGGSSVFITCTLNADCWNVHMSPFVIAPAGRIGGFTLIGQGGSRANAVGLHIGDVIGATFYDLHIDDFLGVNSAALWIDNIDGWFERNFLNNIQMGIHGSGSTQDGNTKHIRITNSGKIAGGNSFVRNEFINIHMTLGSGQIGFSVEGGTNAPFISGNVWTGGANVNDGSTMFLFSGNTAFTDSELFWQQECTACTTGATVFDVGKSATVHYQGEVTNGGMLSNRISGVFTNEISGDAQTTVLDREYFDSNSYNFANVIPSGIMVYQAGNYLLGEGPNVTLKAYDAVGTWGVEYVGAHDSEHYWCTNNGSSACVERMRLKASGQLQLKSLVGTGTRCLRADASGNINAMSGDCILVGSLTTTASTSDMVSILGMTQRGHCSVSATNAEAAANMRSTFISAKAEDQITINHVPSAGLTYDILCSPN